MNPGDLPDQPDHFNSAAEVRSLKSLFHAALLALIVLAVAVDIYLGKQMRLAQRQYVAQRQNIDESERLLRSFVVAMDSFAATNKDFQPIFDRYRPVFGKYLAAPASAEKK
jgi:hypothetical protein